MMVIRRPTNADDNNIRVATDRYRKWGSISVIRERITIVGPLERVWMLTEVASIAILFFYFFVMFNS